MVILSFESARVLIYTGIFPLISGGFLLVKAYRLKSWSTVRGCSPHKVSSDGLLASRHGVVSWDVASFLSRDIGFRTLFCSDFDTSKIPSDKTTWFLTSRVAVSNG